MPMYRFCVYENGEHHAESSIELVDLRAAETMARQYTGDLMRSRKVSILDAELEVQVQDQLGLTLFCISVMGTFSAAAAKPVMP
jgi:hypothetical protein